MQQRIFTSESYALEWAKSHLNFESSELVSHTPWARTYQLSGASGRAVLRLLPPAMSQSPTTTPQLARRFPEVLPEVISKDDELGLLLLRRYQGRRLDRNASDEERRRLLHAYGELQAEVRQQADLLALFPALDLDSLVARLLVFLDPTGPRHDSGDQVGSVYFMGRTRTRRYHDPLSKRAKLLEKQIAATKRLPATINHCDLRLKNATLTPGDSIILDNWNDATMGPAGLSLHALFGGCATPEAVLHGRAAAANSKHIARNRYVLDAYINVLVDGDYASRADLEDCLPGAICAGAIQQILWYASYPSDSRSYRRRVRRTLTSRLSDLLDFCDAIALREKDLAIVSALDYRKNNRPGRAESILRRRISINNNDPQAHAQLASLLHENGRQRGAIAAYRDAIELNPNSADLHSGYGLALMEKLRLDDAISMFRQSLHLDGSRQDVAKNLARACHLRECVRDAEDQDVVPTLPVSDAEQSSGILRPESLALGAMLFEKYGALLVTNAFKESLIRECEQHLTHQYKDYFGSNVPSDALPVGEGRYQFRFALEGPFSDPALYGNSLVLSLMKALLGAGFFLGSAAHELALPGAKYVRTHKDHRALFTKSADDPPPPSPPFAITTLLPLVLLDEMSGTPTVRKRSQLKSRRDSANLPRQVPILPVGSCLLADRRLSYAELGNKTNRVTPVVRIVYQQSWFVDIESPAGRLAPMITKEERKKIPDSLGSLFR